MDSVTWTLDVEDRAMPEQAVLPAYLLMRRREARANCFHVQDDSIAVCELGDSGSSL